MKRKLVKIIAFVLGFAVGFAGFTYLLHTYDSTAEAVENNSIVVNVEEDIA